MAIRVTCAKCHTRFNVSEKFAGKEGPCPKCKTKIKIPAKNEEVVVHEPEISGPKSVTGEAVLNPIRRKETKFTNVHIALIASLIIGFLLCALLFNFTFADKHAFPIWLLCISAIAMAPPICFAAYFMLRDQELAGYGGKELWVRVLICSAVYALLWIAMPLGKYAFGDTYDTGAWILALVIMGGAGAGVAMLAFDIDYLMGLVHFGLYLGLCILGRLIAGIGFLPGALDQPEAVDPNNMTAMLIHIEPFLTSMPMMFGIG